MKTLLLLAALTLSSSAFASFKACGDSEDHQNYFDTETAKAICQEHADQHCGRGKKAIRISGWSIEHIGGESCGILPDGSCDPTPITPNLVEACAAFNCQ